MSGAVQDWVAHPLKQDARRMEAEAWGRWMTCAAHLAQRFHDECDADDPFSYNETASVSHLTAAAAMAGYLALAEFSTIKRAQTNLRRNTNGRADFWMAIDNRDWWFEFKQITYGILSEQKCEQRWEAATSCARTNGRATNFDRVAGLILPLARFMDKSGRGDLYESKLELVRRFAKSRQFAWELGELGRPWTIICFQIVYDP